MASGQSFHRWTGDQQNFCLPRVVLKRGGKENYRVSIVSIHLCAFPKNQMSSLGLVNGCQQAASCQEGKASRSGPHPDRLLWGQLTPDITDWLEMAGVVQKRLQVKINGSHARFHRHNIQWGRVMTAARDGWGKSVCVLEAGATYLGRKWGDGIPKAKIS